MKLAIRALTLWALLAGLVWLFASSGYSRMTMPSVFGGTRVETGFNSPMSLGLVSALIPAAGMWLTITAVTVLPRRWPVRLGFWMVTIAAWCVVGVMMQARTELDFPRRAAVWCGVGVTGITAIWCLIKVRAFLGWRLLGEVAIAAVLCAVIGDVLLVSYQAETRALRERAEARWTEIGLPMAEFEKTLVATHENAGSAVLRQILREEVGAPFYRPGTPAAAREAAIEGAEKKRKLREDVGAITSGASLAHSDDVNLSFLPVATIKPLASELDADYRRILDTAPPTWASDPHDGASIDVPNFLGVRQFALLAAADASRLFYEGDQEGAERAISAGLRITASLRQNPSLVSFMIHIAVDAMMASKLAHLPASEEGLRDVARDTAELRAEFLRRIQLESWRCLRFTDQMGEAQQTEVSVLPRWLGQIWRRRQVVKAALNGAEYAAIEKNPATLALPDLGISRLDAISDASPTVMEFNVSRAVMRVTATQLLREQAELIRVARARLATGMPMEPYQSAVVPAAHWELSIDFKKATLSTRLIGAPAWIYNDVVTTPQFWCLRIDGSETWQFHQPAQETGGK